MNNTSALLVMDMQEGILRNLPMADTVVGTIARAIEKARNLALPIIYVTLAFRDGFPEISADNKMFSGAKERFAGMDPAAFSTIAAPLAPRPGDLRVTKKRFSAFTGSDLEVILRARQIRHLILTGVSTSGVVLSTLREAADKDFVLTVLSDGCDDADEEVHRVLTTKIFPRQASVCTTGEWQPG